MKKTALIMAGGKGERFWPKSRQGLPKQFLSLTGDNKTMIQLAVERISDNVLIADTFVVTNEKYKELVKEQLPGLPEENIICEPEGRNTAPCIGLGAAVISSRYPDEDPTIIVLPSDHMVKDVIAFNDRIKTACEAADEKKGIVTIGIRPGYPETGYGYIRYDRSSEENGVFKDSSFVEKPDLDTAKKYLESGEYLWNSGMFVWNLSTIRDSFKTFLPETYDVLKKIKEHILSDSTKKIKELFKETEAESVDYAIMEKADNIYIIPGDFGWDDVGSWLALSRINDTDQNGNFITGNVTALDTYGCIIDSSSDRLVATLGAKDLVIVDTEDVLLVTDKAHAADIKTLISELKNTKDRYL